MIILSRPSPEVNTLLFTRNSENLSNFEFYSMGRYALLSGLTKIGVKKGDVIIVPAYICYSVIQPLEGYGYNIKYIDVDSNLDLSIDDIKKIAFKSKVKAILIVHYFGFTKKLDSLVDECCKLGIKVIEDASHSFLSQFSLDRSNVNSDLEIFSLRKSFPVKDGGAFRLNHIYVSSCREKCSPLISDLKYLLVRYIERALITLQINIYNVFITRLKKNVRNKRGAIKHDTCFNPCEPSFQLSCYLNSKQYLKKTRTCIVANFNQLSKGVDELGFKLLARHVDCNMAPQAVVIHDETFGLVDYLRSNGIGAWRWPNEEMPSVIFKYVDQYPNSIHFNKSLVALPVHQSIDKKQINYMLKILKQYGDSND